MEKAVMKKNRKSDALSYQDKVFNELYDTNALVNATKIYCQEREFNGEYYGMPKIYTAKVSEERNQYISLLTIISDKLNNINSINLNLEREISSL